MNANLFTAFNLVAARPALRPAGGEVMTYGDLGREAARLANSLKVMGVAPGDRVAVQVEKSVESVVLYLACLQAGAVYLPLNTAYTDSELDYFFGDAEPSLIVCKPDRVDGIRALGASADITIHTLDAAGNGSLIDHAASMDTSFNPVQRVAADLAAILYTSFIHLGRQGVPRAP